jgi:hypothetical protein
MSAATTSEAIRSTRSKPVVMMMTPAMNVPMKAY